jgi:DNA-binding NtrC family response regulator
MKTPIPNSPELSLKSKTMRPARTGNRLLLISDAPERMRNLASAFRLGEVEMTKVSSAEELNHNSDCVYDVAIVDVAPRRLAEILKALRESEQHTRIPVLVERSRLANDGSLASVLPSYRAMPCSFEEMMKLARRSLMPAPPLQLAESRERRHLL